MVRLMLLLQEAHQVPLPQLLQDIQNGGRTVISMTEPSGPMTGFVVPVARSSMSSSNVAGDH
jgi:hypothetical protein